MRVGAPVAVTVIVPVLENEPVFALTFTLKLPLPIRLVGHMLDTVSQDVLLLLIFHIRSDVTCTVKALAADVGSHCHDVSAK